MSAVRSVGSAARQLANGGAGPAAVILGYHDVVAKPPLPGGHQLTVTGDQLRAHIRLLQRLGFTLVPLGQLVGDLEAAAVKRFAALTFDDALVGVGEIAQPILAEFGVSATVFATSGTPGAAPSWWPGARPTMTGTQLSELASAGIEIGCHSVTHRSLVALDDEALQHELRTSRRWLQDVTGQPVDLFAYPEGHQDERVRAAVASSGFRAACTFLNGRVEGAEDPFRLPRLTMGAHSSLPRLAYHLLRSPSSWPDHQIDAGMATGA